MSSKNIVKCILCDMDGVLLIGNQPIAGLQNIFSYFKELKIQPMIITNECRYTNKKVYDDLEKMKIIKKDDDIPLVTSANVCKTWLENYIYVNKSKYSIFNIYVIGEKGLQENISSISNKSLMQSSKWNTDKFAKNILIIGSLFNYTHHHKNIIEDWIENTDTLIVKTCDDNSDPEESCTLPNTILQNFNIQAHINTGKPDINFSKEIKRILKQKQLCNILNSEIMLIGDTMNTDIKMGNMLGYKTVLVLSGNTKKYDLKTYTYQPEYILPSLEYIDELLE